MVPDGLDWAIRALRACRAARDTGWWLRLSVRQAMLEAVADEAARVATELRAVAGPVNGTLRQSLSRTQP